MTVMNIAEPSPVRAEAFRGWARGHAALLALLTVIIVLSAYTATRSDVFLTWGNVANILLQVSVLAVLAAGTTMLMIAGGIDLSIGAMLSVVAVTTATLTNAGLSVPAGVLLALALGAVLGAVNGTLAAFSTSHPFIITLGVAIILQGVALSVTNGTPISNISSQFLQFGAGRTLGLANPVWVAAAALAIAAAVLRYTVFGRRLFALGGNENAVRLSGVNVRVLKVCLYAVNGLFVAVAACLLMSRIGSAQPLMGNGYELTAIAAVAVGGTPLAGGRGSIVGTILGVLLLGVISNSLNLLGVSGSFQYVLQGLVIVVAVMTQRQR